MFSDFDPAKRAEEGRGRRAASLLLAGGAFVVLAVSIGAAVANARGRVDRPLEVDVELAPPPPPAPEPPEPPPPEPAAPPPPARRATRAPSSSAPPTSIPDERPREQEGTLAEEGPGGDGGGEGEGPFEPEGRATPEPPPPPAPPPPAPPPPAPPRPRPTQERVEIQAPVRLSGCERPERPASLDGATAETIRIRVRVLIGADGAVESATIVDGHALVPEEPVLECVRTQRFTPASLEGTAVPYVFTYVFTFRPDVL